MIDDCAVKQEIIISRIEVFCFLCQFLDIIKSFSLNKLYYFQTDGDYRVTEESMTERLNTNIHEACLSIDESCK